MPQYASYPAGIGTTVRMQELGASIGAMIGRIRTAVWAFGPTAASPQILKTGIVELQGCIVLL